MSTIHAVPTSIPMPALRRMAGRDLPQMLQIARQTRAPGWIGKDFPTIIQSHVTIGCVAEIRKRIAGFLICTATRQPDPLAAAAATPLARLVHRLVGKHLPHLLHVTLLDVVVAPEWPQPEIERALLEQFDRELRRSGDRVQVTVPETNLPAQLFLRDAGYRAIAVLRGHYGSDDGYLMVPHHR